MSTKSTIASGEDFHFYTEMFDDENVHLWLNDADFVASPHGLTVTIPRAIFETLRRTEPMSFELVEVTDGGLLARATEAVDAERRRRDEARQASEGQPVHPDMRPLMAFLCSNDTPREQEIEGRLDCLKSERERQQRILAQMKGYEISNGAVFAINFRGGTSEVVCGSVTDGTGEPTQPSGE